MRYHKKYLMALLAVCCMAGSACNNPGEATDTTATATAGDTNRQDASPPYNTLSADTLVIDRKAAIFYEPDSLQIAQRKAAIGENNFYIGVEDYAYYLNMSHDYLDSARLRLLDAKGKRFLKFVGNNQHTQIIRLDTLPELWGIYFFEPAKKAKKVNMTMIEDEYAQYFN